MTLLVLRALHVEPRTSTFPTTPGDRRSCGIARSPISESTLEAPGVRSLDLQAAAQQRQRADRQHAEQQELQRRGRDHAEQSEDPDHERGDAEEDDDETSWRGEFSDNQCGTGSEPHPPFHMHRIIEGTDSVRFEGIHATYSCHQ